ncbi:MAG: hypothetical protein WA021_05880 [Minisyncoccia bacterium]
MSKVGLVLAGAYLAASAYFIGTQGLFGESFISLILGMPWTLGLAYFEYFNATGAVMYVLALAPIALNTYILYKIGGLFSR